MIQQHIHKLILQLYFIPAECQRQWLTARNVQLCIPMMKSMTAEWQSVDIRAGVTRGSVTLLLVCSSHTTWRSYHNECLMLTSWVWDISSLLCSPLSANPTWLSEICSLLSQAQERPTKGFRFKDVDNIKLVVMIGMPRILEKSFRQRQWRLWGCVSLSWDYFQDDTLQFGFEIPSVTPVLEPLTHLVHHRKQCVSFPNQDSWIK